jgi:8-oxo-dGTP pyrophosphatase MutT (NUDIX family)
MLTFDAVRRALRGYVPQSAETPDARPAAVALMLIEEPGGLEALFIKRAVRAGDPWSGQVALPGGRREPADRDLLATAMRETREEVGVDLTRVERLGQLHDMNPRTPTLPPIYVRPFVFALPAKPRLTVSDEEVQRAFWVPLARFTAPGVRRDFTLTLAGVERTFPAYDLDDDVIWGMTERILTPFIELISAKR